MNQTRIGRQAALVFEKYLDRREQRFDDQQNMIDTHGELYK